MPQNQATGLNTPKETKIPKKKTPKNNPSLHFKLASLFEHSYPQSCAKVVYKILFFDTSMTQYLLERRKWK